jgi:outer membrane protein assembly factor BamD
MNYRLFILFLVSLLVSSCGEYEKLLKSTDYELKKTKAREYYAQAQYVRASELLGQVIPRFRATGEAEELNWLNAQSYYGMKQYEIAGSLYKSLVEQYPYGQYAEEATFLGALCDYNLAPRAQLDQQSSKNSIEGFNVFINKFPYSPKVEEARKYIDELQERLVEKSYLNARLYYDMKEYKAAITALSNSLKEFSSSKYREEMMFLKLNSTYLYAVNSFTVKQTERYQAALDDYFSFMEEYPQSRYSREVRRIYQETTKFLKIKNIENLANNQQ